MKTNISIIMPPFLGDCIMAIPLLNHLAKYSNIYIVCNEYVYDILQNLFENTRVSKISSEPPKNDVVVDLLGDSKSVKFVIQTSAKISIGFPDAKYNYTYSLPLPYNYSNEQASEIYLASLRFLQIPKPLCLNFSFPKNWIFNKQDLILIAPGAGNLKRCFSFTSFLKLARKLSTTNKVCFILGPSEQHLAQFIHEQFDIILSNTIESTLSHISRARMLIASEGGFMHLAAAYGIPLIGIFKIASPKNWFPYSNHQQVAIGDGQNNYDNLNLKVNFPMKEIISKTQKIYEKIGN
jgi:ADP-heptose:LPS heptosyltransferase